MSRAQFVPDPVPAAARPNSPRSARGTAKQRGEVAAVQEERRRVAQLLHDTVCQELTGISLLASAASQRHCARHPEVGRELEEMSDLIQRAGVRLAEIVHGLRPPGKT